MLTISYDIDTTSLLSECFAFYLRAFNPLAYDFNFSHWWGKCVYSLLNCKRTTFLRVCVIFFARFPSYRPSTAKWGKIKNWSKNRLTRPIRLLTFLFPIYAPMSLLYFPRHFSSISCHASQQLTLFSQHSCHCTFATPFSRSFLPQFIASSHDPASSQDSAATRSFSAAVRLFLPQSPSLSSPKITISLFDSCHFSIIRKLAGFAGIHHFPANYSTLVLTLFLGLP
mgnify:CR=1 FL=1